MGLVAASCASGSASTLPICRLVAGARSSPRQPAKVRARVRVRVRASGVVWCGVV